MVEQRFIDYWRQQQQQQAGEIALLKKQAWKDVKQIAAMLKQNFGVTRVFVYGSLLKERFSANSDIDIAAAGIPKERFFGALAAVNQSCDRWVDLKPIESLEPYFWQRIQSQGVWIDETEEPN